METPFELALISGCFRAIVEEGFEPGDLTVLRTCEYLSRAKIFLVFEHY